MFSSPARAVQACWALRVVTAMLASGTLVPVMAAEWQFSPSVEIAETYTDNLTLQPAGQAEDEFVTEINPGFVLVGEGRRLDLSFSYRLQNLIFAQQTNRNTSNHQLLAWANAELLREMLFFDANTSLAQRIVDPEGAIGQGNIAITGNRTDVATVRLSPYLKKRLGAWSMLELRYTHDNVHYPDSDLEDSLSNTATVSLADIKTSDRWFWRLDYSTRSVAYSGELRPDERHENAALNLDYRLSRKLGLNGVWGYEDNEFERAPTAVTPNGEYWNLGVTWQPTQRTNVVLGGGHRFFGTVWNAAITHRARHSTLSGGYSEELSTRRQYFLSQELDALGRPVFDPDTLLPVMTSVPFDEVFLQRRGQLSLDFQTRKSTTTLSVYAMNRQYQKSLYEEDVNGGGLNWSWRHSQRSTLSVGANLQLTEEKDQPLPVDRLLTSRVTFDRQIGQRLMAAAELRQTKRERGGGSGDYTENLITARLSMNW